MRDCFTFRCNELRRSGGWLIKILLLALTVAASVPARAGEDRAVKTRVPPVYPEIAKRMKVDGIVRLEVTVDAEGKVTDVKALSGNRMLSPAAEDAVRKWRFVPAAGSSTVNVEVGFTL